ncbi:MAG TPA: hypothetical protein PLK08_04660, partial [Phycisphaerae bacterium]|nr:hypothetical protein [Phycisphaerae bacterium]
NLPKLPKIWLTAFIISSLVILYLRYHTDYLGQNIPLLECKYTSPYVLLQAFFITCFFISLEYNNQKINDICSRYAPFTLGIYLAHPIIIYVIDAVTKNCKINSWILVPTMTIAVYFATLAMVLIFRKIPLLKAVV